MVREAFLACVAAVEESSSTFEDAASNSIACIRSAKIPLQEY